MNKIHPIIILIMRIIIGSVFIYASYDKILEPGQFARNISNYHIVPFGLENTVAIILPWLELIIGLGIIFGLFINANVMISGGLLIVFISMIIQAILRGFNIDCGCGLKEGEMVGWSKVIENTLFLGVCYIIYHSKNRIFEFYPKTTL
ncbi:MAG: DoxX family protein [Euryarchaeota archaeon]|nr:DoxX family protein [Euryarchaeota archaeon]|tara:strand:- start:120 stop:563 length:444 start_codon:yes stop_codon:yes gene_type:complete